ncbi:hypothetical protein LCGC14_1150070 [marine sediment metagenome]|uniref:Uncharacterized protein n=1 Tax=marine sediment metagenome TaxID=412755 RepID=A0A0F9LVQ2_9ZZZZ
MTKIPHQIRTVNTHLTRVGCLCYCDCTNESLAWRLEKWQSVDATGASHGVAWKAVASVRARCSATNAPVKQTNVTAQTTNQTSATRRIHNE